MMDQSVDIIVLEVQQGAKYRHLHPDLVRNIAEIEIKKGRSRKETVKAIRNKIHQVGSAYQPVAIPYEKFITKLETLPGDLQDPSVKEFCLEVMQLHTSTVERLPILHSFYDTILQDKIPVQSILDVACGLNPLSLPWISFEKDAQIYVCDIYTDQIDFLNQFFAHFNIQGKAFCCDLTQEIPDVRTQIAFILKTIPCLEQIDKQIGSRLLNGIQSDNLLISFPVQSLGGRDKGMRKFYDEHFRQMIADQGWQVQSHSFVTEEVYFVRK